MKQGYTAVLLTFIDLVGCVIMHTSNLLRIHFNFSVCLNVQVCIKLQDSTLKVKIRTYKQAQHNDMGKANAPEQARLHYEHLQCASDAQCQTVHACMTFSQQIHCHLYTSQNTQQQKQHVLKTMLQSPCQSNLHRNAVTKKSKHCASQAA